MEGKVAPSNSKNVDASVHVSKSQIKGLNRKEGRGKGSEEGERKGREEGELVRKARLTASEYEIGGEPELRVLNLGEGWRSIAKAVLKHYPTARVGGGCDAMSGIFVAWRRSRGAS